jgi:SAM-dependent methyltransferase
MADVDLATADGQDRYVPSATRDIMSAGHEGVYEWVAEHLVKKGARALDLGCGTGYGVALLAGAGATADGADSSPAAIAYATKHYGATGIRFFVADLVKPLPKEFAPQSYDLVVSSEVLEHVVDPFAYVRGMADSAVDDGVCFVGTPNRLWSNGHLPAGHLLAPSHLMEFTPPALIALLETVFEDVSLMVRVFPEGAMNTEEAPSRPRPQVITATAALVRKVAPGVVARVKRAVDPAPAQPAQEWLASDIVWAPYDDPTVDMDRAVGLAAVCHRPRRSPSTDKLSSRGGRSSRGSVKQKPHKP